MRRLRRRAVAAHTNPDRPFCRTNGCASFLEVDASAATATCAVCGATQRMRSRPAH
jgi:transcription elongation factor Elf1